MSYQQVLYQQRHTATSLLCVTSAAIYCAVHDAPDTRCVAAPVGIHSDITHHFTYFYMHTYTLRVNTDNLTGSHIGTLYIVHLFFKLYYICLTNAQYVC